MLKAWCERKISKKPVQMHDFVSAIGFNRSHMEHWEMGYWNGER
jgi:hypothetical protein